MAAAFPHRRRIDKWASDTPRARRHPALGLFFFKSAHHNLAYGKVKGDRELKNITVPLQIQNPRNFDGAIQLSTFVEAPGKCPICDHWIEPKYIAAYIVGADTLEVVFACPRRDCQRLFVIRHEGQPAIAAMQSLGFWKVVGRFPVSLSTKTFEQLILNLSPRFVAIYNQAYHAEQTGLDMICGPGYRKALEFLMKDYAKSRNGADSEQIEAMPLAACISQYSGDSRIKGMAARATWLGNDETHYVRKWEDKDLSDLKKLIDLTIYWVSSELLTEELKASMPDPKAKV
jgi:hypothetical protein